MPVLIFVVWLAGAVLAVLAGFEPDPYLTHVRQMPAPHPYPTNATAAVLVLMTMHAGLLAAIYRRWQQILSWRRATVALCICAAFLPAGAMMALHAPPPVSVYLVWLLIVTAAVALAALWRIAFAAAAALRQIRRSNDNERRL